MNLEWMDSAACRHHDPELFFASDAGRPGQDSAIVEALRVCAACPVIVQCRDYQKQVGASFGVWGGRMVRDRTYTMPQWVPPHGTEARYRRERMLGQVCRVCREAASRARDARNRRAV